MWCLETIVRINEKAAELIEQGRPQRDALRECTKTPAIRVITEKLVITREPESIEHDR